MEAAVFEKQNIQETVNELKSDAVKGLTDGEAFRRLQQNGRNEMKAARKKTKIQLFLEQLKDPLIYILLIAAVVSVFLGELSDAVIIGTVVVVNALVGMLQEGKARKALEALKKLTSPQTIVIREGIRQEIPAAELVTGDLVDLEAGAQVPADIRLTRSSNLQVEESALTGESVPVEKDALFLADCRHEIPLAERVNMVYMSTVVTHGHGEGIVTATGMATEIGRIASMITDAEEEMTPLQKRLGDMGKLLSILSLGVCAALFLLAVFQHRNIPEMLLVAISLAVAAVPEGLPAVVTICLALSVTRMVKVHTIIRRLPSVETLGAVSVVCSDKTGTLTQNRLTVEKCWWYDVLEDAAGSNGRGESRCVQEMLRGILLCNDASLQGEQRIGDPTELALLDFGEKMGMHRERLEKQYPRYDEKPFDSDRKMMTTYHRIPKNGGHKGSIAYTKGAPDVIVQHCTHILQDGRSVPMTAGQRKRISEVVELMNSLALRTLAAAQSGNTPGCGEEGMTFLGIVGMRDPARPEAIIIAEHYGDASPWLQGDQWDTVMNYDAFMEPISWFLTGLEKHSDQYRQDLKGNAECFRDSMRYNGSRFYAPSLLTAMNELDNHDHSRFLTRTNSRVGRINTVGARAAEEGINKAILREAVAIQMTWPGAPTVYYGDEAGVCGFTDPDNRRTYPWGHEDQYLVQFYRDAIRMHRELPVLKYGSVKMLKEDYNLISFGRFNENEQVVVVINNNNENKKVEIPVWETGISRSVDTTMTRILDSNAIAYDMEQKEYPVVVGYLELEMSPLEAIVLCRGCELPQKKDEEAVEKEEDTSTVLEN